MSELSAREFERRFQALLRAGAPADNTGSVACERCKACSDCTFCKDSQQLVRCHFCVHCVTCSDSLHCSRSRGLIGCAHCTACRDCSHSSYLVRCVALSGCQYCFGCVGLSGKDFHVLNEPYDRKAYFALTERLRRELEP